jgi:hypothetical protein
MTTKEENERSEELMRERMSSIAYVDEEGKVVRPKIEPDKMDLGEEEYLEPEDMMTDEEYLESEEWTFEPIQQSDQDDED